MSLSRLAARCRACPFVDTCDHKEMEAYGVLPLSTQRGIHVRFVNPQLGIDETKLLHDGTIQIPEFVFFGDQGATIYLWCDSGSGTVSVDFRQGRL